MKYLAYALLVFLPFCNCLAAKDLGQKSLSTQTLEKTKTILEMVAPAQRVDKLKSLGPSSYKDLISVAFAKDEKLSLRWRAMMAMANVAGPRSLPELRRAVEHKEWFLRNIGIMLMSQIDKKEAASHARRLLSDPALVVRSTAVKVIQALGDRQSAPLLWKKLYAKENYRKGSSLWIRRQIVEALAELAEKKDITNWIKVLKDKDVKLHPTALSALNQLVPWRSPHLDKRVEERKQEWLSWWQEGGVSNKGVKAETDVASPKGV